MVIEKMNPTKSPCFLSAKFYALIKGFVIYNLVQNFLEKWHKFDVKPPSPTASVVGYASARKQFKVNIELRREGN